MEETIFHSFTYSSSITVEMKYSDVMNSVEYTDAYHAYAKFAQCAHKSRSEEI